LPTPTHPLHGRLSALLAAFLTLLTMIACGGSERRHVFPSQSIATTEAAAGATVVDPHSYARPEEVVVRHIHVDLKVDFDSRQLIGSADLKIDNKAGTDHIDLDTRDLNIRSVRLDDDRQVTPFTLADADPILGRKLTIPLRPATRAVHIDYSTRPGAGALQWVTPRQTAGQAYPYLYSQNEPILARTWIPCQDTPSVRATYDARISVPVALRAVMSAENPLVRSKDGIYRFKMQQPIPSYLIALAVGDIDFRAVDERTGVFAEPPVVQSAAWEFAEMPQMIQAAEGLYGPYLWGRYDLLVLPPSFPFGGMENPRLTFATPTSIAGDRSLVALIAHELAHSWSGNLVTNATWNDTWLNEGFTTYAERRVMEALRGPEYAEMLWQLGYQDLQEVLRRIGPESQDTQLHMHLAGRDPDTAFSNIAYEKGAIFLRMLERRVGRGAWDAFLTGYIERFEFQPMTTARFEAYLKTRLLDPVDVDRSSLQLHAWLYEPGLPDNAPRPHSRRFARVDDATRQWLSGSPLRTLPTEAWSTHEWLHFLRGLPNELSANRMAALDETFHFTDSGNSEILDRWLQLAIEHHYAPANAALERFLTTVGRLKFVLPLYSQLAATPQGLKRARAIYSRARPGYHPLTVRAVDGILKWDSKGDALSSR
jgi:leukotriene-A4 hydrolase